VPDGIRKRPGGVDDDARGDAELGIALDVARDDAVDCAARGPGDVRDPHVVEQDRALISGGLCHVDQQPGVVELAIVVQNAAAKAGGAQRRYPPERRPLRQDLRTAEAALPGQQAVRHQADAVERRLPPLVGRDDEGEGVDEVRCIRTEESTFLQRADHQRDVALLEIPHAAVNELGAAARGALAEVALFQQEDGVSA
jgi:hypothetical protein